MEKFLTLTIEFGSKIDIAVEKIIIKETGKYIGIGSRIVDILHPNGTINKQCDFTITRNKNREEQLSIDGEIIPSEYIGFNKYCFNNFDY